MQRNGCKDIVKHVERRTVVVLFNALSCVGVIVPPVNLSTYAPRATKLFGQFILSE